MYSENLISAEHFIYFHVPHLMATIWTNLLFATIGKGCLKSASITTFTYTLYLQEKEKSPLIVFLLEPYNMKVFIIIVVPSSTARPTSLTSGRALSCSRTLAIYAHDPNFFCFSLRTLKYCVIENLYLNCFSDFKIDFN